MLQDALVSKLSADAAVTALVSARIYPLDSVENIYPFIVYSIQRQTDESITANALLEHDIDVSCVGMTYDSAKSVAAAVIAALDRSGEQYGTAWTGATVRSCILQPTNENSTPDNGNAERIYREIDLAFALRATP